MLGDMSDRPSIRTSSVTLATPAPRDLAEFYARLLGAELRAEEDPRPGEPPGAGWAQLKTENLTLNFEYEQWWTPPVWPAEPGRPGATQHLDLSADDLEAAAAWAIECGASVAGVQPQDEVRVMFDPHGHPFCLFV